MSLPSLNPNPSSAEITTDIQKRIAELPPVPLHLPADLEEKLVRLKFQRRLIAIAQAVIALGGALCFLWLAQGMADWSIGLPWVVRAILLVGDCALLMWIHRRYFPGVFRCDPGLRQVALVAERRWPDLRQCLISAVELCEGTPGTTRGSYRLTLEVIAEARWKAQSLNFNEVAPWRMFRIAILAGGILVAGALDVVHSAWPMSGILLKRILLSTTSQTMVIPITKDLAAPVGSDVVLSARTMGRIPTEGRVTIEYAGKPKQEVPVAPDPERPDTFSLTVRNVQKPFTYQFRLNDGESPLFSVDVEVPPLLATIVLKVVYPHYTGLPPEDRSPANLSILAGSHLWITATATQSLRNATIQLLGAKSPSTIEMTLDPSGKNLEGDIFIPPKDLTGFSIRLVNKSGFPSAGDMVYPVYPVPDRPPVVRIREPDLERETIVPQANPVLVVDAGDDYGIAKLVLKYQCAPPGVNGHPGAALPVRDIPLPFDHPKAAHVEYTLNVAAQVPVWQEGWVIDYWIEATDNNDVTGPGLTKTKPKHFEVVSVEENVREIAVRLQQAANSLDSVAGQQDKATNQVSQGINR